MSTRRNFLRTLATAAFGFSVLPSAKTYERIWKAVATHPTIPVFPESIYVGAFITTSPWIGGIFPTGLAETIDVLTYERCQKTDNFVLKDGLFKPFTNGIS